MLSRSGLGIRRLISQRGWADGDINGEDPLVPVAVPVMGTGQNGDGKSHIMTNKRSNSRRRALINPLIVSSSLIHSSFARPLPPVPIETRRSSASSSSDSSSQRCIECDCPLDTDFNEKQGSPHYSIQSKEGNVYEESTLLPLVDINTPDDTLTYRIPKSKFNLSRSPRSSGEALPALSLETGYKDESSQDRQRRENPSPELSEEGRHFMRETEDAFKAIGGNLSEVQLDPIHIFHLTKTNSLETSHDSDQAPLSRGSKGNSLKSHSRSSSTMSSEIPRTSTGDLPLDTSPPLTVKPKREKPKTSKQPKAMKSQWKPAAAKSGPRWMLTENVSGLLAMFNYNKGIEADEMITPDQIEEYKQRRMAKANAEGKTTEVTEDSLADLPTIPLTLEDRPSSSASARTDKSDASIARVSAVPLTRSLARRNPSFKKRRQSREQQRLSIHRNSQFITKPSRTSRLATRSGMMGLPMIPETAATTRSDGTLLNNRNSEDSLDNHANSEFVFLQSSPRSSMMMPAFRHGPIRLNKSDLGPKVPLGGDEAIYWTAFQMAILGGAGEWFDTYSDDEDERQTEEDELEELYDWFDSFHFEGKGELVTQEEDDEPASPTSSFSGDELSEIGSDNATTSHYGWQGTQRGTPPRNLRLNVDFEKERLHHMSAHCYPENYVYSTSPWRRESHSKPTPAANRESVASLPTSPMLDLRVTDSGNGDDVDIVPMGYNLGHDLGDFLRWEAEHTYAGFTSPTRVNR